MTDATASERWQDALTRRVRTLIRTAPLHAAEAWKARRELDLSRVDLRGLALRVLDAVIEEMGIGRGAVRADVIAELARMAREMEPGLAEADAREVASFVLDGMLNEGGRRRAFVERYRDWSATPPVERDLEWHLLREVELPDGDFVLRATAEGINVYTGMLDHEVEDAQVAEEAVLHAQVRRGRIQDAVRTAQNARLRSIEYQETLRRILRLVQRDVVQVRWREDVIARLRGAREHLGERMEVERDLAGMVSDKMDDASPEDGPRFAELLDILQECRKRHLRLQRELLGATKTFLSEQDRQLFKPRAVLRLPDLEAEVTAPALELAVGALSELIGPLLRAFVPASARPMVHLPQLVDRLLAPSRAVAAPGPDLRELVLEEVDATRPYFASADFEAVAAALAALGAGPATLSALLGELRRGGAGPAAEELLVLSTLQAWEPSAAPTPRLLVERAAGRRIDDPRFDGDELTVSLDTPASP